MAEIERFTIVNKDGLTTDIFANSVRSAVASVIVAAHMTVDDDHILIVRHKGADRLPVNYRAEFKTSGDRCPEITAFDLYRIVKGGGLGKVQHFVFRDD